VLSLIVKGVIDLNSERKYQRDYYEKNKEEILRKRREKYQGDAEYRAKVMERARKYRKKQCPLTEIRGRKKGPLPPVRVNAKSGKLVQAYSTGYVADKLGITMQTLRKWVRKGKIPETPYWISTGRVWTQRMVNAMIKAKGACRSTGGTRSKNYFSQVRESWPWDEMK